MGRGAGERKNRVCRVCLETMQQHTAEDLKKHAVICSFEKRTGLVVVQSLSGLEAKELGV